MQRIGRGREAGFTFHELLAAMGLTVLVVMSYSLSSVGVIQRQVVSDNSTVAIHLAQDKIEELQARGTLDDSDLCPGGGDHAISAKTGVAGVFDRCWKIAPSPLGARLKQIDVTVSWQDFQAREFRLSTLSFAAD
jgi:hypothetical protein